MRPATEANSRLVFLDWLRILAIVLISFEHLSTHIPVLHDKYNIDFNLWNMYQFDWGHVGIVIFLFVSGFSLALSNTDIDSRKKIKEFYMKRILRIYPAYYLALFFSIIIQPNIIQKTFTLADYVKTGLAFQALGARTEADIYGKINGPLWFLTPLILLYIMFPLLSYVIKRHAHMSIVTIFAINQASLYFFSIQTFFFGANWWFPLCVVFPFSLGIYLMRIGVYPKITGKNKAIIYLSNITFFIYLINAPLLVLGDYPILFALGLLTFGSVLYEFDCRLRDKILNLSERH